MRPRAVHLNPASLRAAIENANASPGSTIEFSGFTGSSPITVALALPVITARGHYD